MPPDPSKRQGILGQIESRLSAIAVGPTFNTNAGAAVHIGELAELGPDDPDVVIAVVPGDEEVPHRSLGVVQWTVEIQAVAKAEVNDAWITVEQVTADIKRAMELPNDRTLNGLVKDDIRRGNTRVLPRTPGTTTVGVAIPYTFTFVEQWGEP